MVAARAIAAGVDSPALVELAGLGRADVREAGDLLTIAMAELGNPLRESKMVLWSRAALAAEAFLDGTLDASDAAASISRLLCQAGHRTPDGQIDNLATDIELLLLDWDDEPEQRNMTAHRIREASERVLETYGRFT